MFKPDSQTLNNFYAHGTLRLSPFPEGRDDYRAAPEDTSLLECLNSPEGENIRNELSEIVVQGWLPIPDTIFELMAELVTKTPSLETFRYSDLRRM